MTICRARKCHPLPHPVAGLGFRSPFGFGMSRDFQAAGRKARPSGLMAGAKALAGFAVEIFVEKLKILPIRVGCENTVGTVPRTVAGSIAQEEPREAGGKVARNFVQRQMVAGTGWTFHAQTVAVEFVSSFNRAASWPAFLSGAVFILRWRYKESQPPVSNPE